MSERLNVRLDSEVKKMLEELSSSNKRSMNKEIEFLIEEAYKRKQALINDTIDLIEGR